MTHDLPELEGVSASAIAVLDTAMELQSARVLTVDEIVSVLPEYRDFLSADGNYDAEARLPAANLLQLWQLADDKPTFDIGFEIGRKVNEHRKGLLANWVSQVVSLREALGTFVEHIPLLNPLERWQIASTNGKISLEFSLSQGINYPPIAIHRSMVAMIAWGRTLCGREFKVEQFDLVQQNVRFPEWMGDWCEQFQSGARANRLVISEAVLSFPIPKHNPYLETIIKPIAKNLLREVETLSFKGKVLTYLHKDLRRFSDIKSVCEELHISRSTLFRRLKSENVSFTDLLNQVRRERYHDLKKQNVKVMNIAYELGFKDTSSFYKASQNWDEV